MVGKDESIGHEKEAIVDICALGDHKYLIQATLGRFAIVKNLEAILSEDDFRPLHKDCQNGDHTWHTHTYIQNPLGVSMTNHSQSSTS